MKWSSIPPFWWYQKFPSAHQVYHPIFQCAVLDAAWLTKNEKKNKDLETTWYWCMWIFDKWKHSLQGQQRLAQGAWSCQKQHWPCFSWSHTSDLRISAPKESIKKTETSKKMSWLIYDTSIGNKDTLLLAKKG